MSLDQRAAGLGVWQEPLVPLRFPKLYCLRSHPFAKGDEVMDWSHWRLPTATLGRRARWKG